MVPFLVWLGLVVPLKGSGTPDQVRGDGGFSAWLGFV